VVIPPAKDVINFFFLARMGEYGQPILPRRRSTSFNFVHLWRIFLRKLFVVKGRCEGAKNVYGTFFGAGSIMSMKKVGESIGLLLIVKDSSNEGEGAVSYSAGPYSG